MTMHDKLSDLPTLFAVGCVVGQADIMYERIPKVVQHTLMAIIIIAGQFTTQHYSVQSDLRQLNTQVRNESDNRISCCIDVKKHIDELRAKHMK